MSSLQSLDIAKRSATTLPSPDARRTTTEVAKLIDVSSCIGCKACQVACMQWNDLRDEVGETHGTYDNPRDLTPQSWTVMRFSEVEVVENKLEWLIRKDGCMHCDDPGCLKACPAPGAIVKYQNGIVDFISEHCVGCGNCVTGCPFDVPKISPKTKKMSKCTLCVDRVTVGLEPACVKACPTGCLHFGSKDDMVELGRQRVAQLVANGQKEAVLYDPPGVGGTSVVTVLAHGDHPEWYGLPKDPHVPHAVKFWKQVLKPVGMVIVGATLLGAFAHYLTYGRKQPDPQDDARKEGT
jgi:formate dehydrogenase iron-sulfur subunit